MLKIAFFDVDGTLLKMGNKEPSDKILYTLKELQNNGVLLCMATGRSYPCIPHFKDIEFDIYMTFNGSYVLNNKDIIFKNPFDEYDKYKILENLKNMNRAVAISNEKLVVANGSDKDLKQYFDFGHVELIIADNFEELCKNDIYQIMCSCVKEEYEHILLDTKNTKIEAWWDKAADIIPATCGKGNAVKAVLDYYGFTKEEAIAFGDGHNDIEMLEAAGIGVAMGNAKDEVKAHADDLCRSVEEDGIYHYCIEHNFI